MNIKSEVGFTGSVIIMFEHIMIESHKLNIISSGTYECNLEMRYMSSGNE